MKKQLIGYANYVIESYDIMKKEAHQLLLILSTISAALTAYIVKKLEKLSFLAREAKEKTDGLCILFQTTDSFMLVTAILTLVIFIILGITLVYSCVKSCGINSTYQRRSNFFKNKNYLEGREKYLKKIEDTTIENKKILESKLKVLDNIKMFFVCFPILLAIFWVILL